MNAKQTVKKYIQLTSILFLFVSIYIFTPSSVIAGTIFSAPSYIGLSEGLIGYWSFNDNDMAQSPSNTFAMDRSGNGNNGKLKNMATSSARVSGKIGQGLSFDGTDDFVSVTHHSSIDLTSALTVALWVKTTVADKWLVEKRDSGQANGWAINGNSDGTFGFGINNGGTTQSITSTSLINDGNWHFLVGVLDAGVV